MFTLQARRFAAAGAVPRRRRCDDRAAEDPGVDVAGRVDGGPGQPVQTAVLCLETVATDRLLQPVFLTWFVTGAATQTSAGWSPRRRRSSVSEVTLDPDVRRGTTRGSASWNGWASPSTARSRGSPPGSRRSTIWSLRVPRPDAGDPGPAGRAGPRPQQRAQHPRNLVFAAAPSPLARTADWRLLLVAVAGLPTLLSTRWSIRWQAEAEERSAEPGRLTTHLLDLGPDAAVAARSFGSSACSTSTRQRLRAAVAAWRAPFVDLAGGARVAVGGQHAVLLRRRGRRPRVDGVRPDRGGSRAEAMVLAVLLVGRLQTIGRLMQWSIRMLSQHGRTTTVPVAARLRREVRAEHAGSGRPHPSAFATGSALEDLTYHYPDADAAAVDGVSPPPARRFGRRARRRERRRQVHPRQAARRPVPARRWAGPRRRRGPAGDSTSRLARSTVRCLPGLRDVRGHAGQSSASATSSMSYDDTIGAAMALGRRERGFLPSLPDGLGTQLGAIWPGRCGPVRRAVAATRASRAG